MWPWGSDPVCLSAPPTLALSVPLALVLGTVGVSLLSLGPVSTLGNECDLIPHLVGLLRPSCHLLVLDYDFILVSYTPWAS